MRQFSLALVTGATSGIGLELCHLLASQGIPLLVTGRNEEALNQLVDVLKLKVSVVSFVADLSEREGIETLLGKIEAFVPDLIVNNAGFGLYGDALDYSLKEQKDLLEVNGTAVLEATLEGARALTAINRQGVICNIASMAAFHISPGMALYASTKRLVVDFSQALDMELEKRGVRVLVACPGMVHTKFADRAGGSKSVWDRRLSMSANVAAQEIWKQIVTLKRCHIFDWKYRLAFWISSCLPSRWVAKKIYKNILNRIYTHRE